MSPDIEQLQHLSAEIEALRPRPHHVSIVAVAQKYLPTVTFKQALSQGGWYRLGGVIRPDGTRLTSDIEAWATAELNKCGDDIGQFLEHHEEEHLIATRWSGQTHYFVAAYGTEPAQFFQLEVEEIQEIVDRQLIDSEQPPADLAELAADWLDALIAALVAS